MKNKNYQKIKEKLKEEIRVVIAKKINEFNNRKEDYITTSVAVIEVAMDILVGSILTLESNSKEKVNIMIEEMCSDMKEKILQLMKNPTNTTIN